MSKKQTAKRQRSFDPGSVAARLHSGIINDLDRGTEVSLDPPTYNFYADVQSKEFLKKVSFTELPDLETQAFLRFSANNDRLGRLVDEFVFPERVHISKLGVRDRVLTRARSICHSMLPLFSEEEWFRRCRHSAGVSIGLEFRNTGLEAKWRLPLSSTRDASRIFHRYMIWDNQMAEAIGYNFDNVESNYNIVESSRLTTVPKNDKARRIIAIEPTANMFLQQGLAGLLSDALRCFGVDISTQQNKHRHLAYIASITRRLATIDWSMASDCLEKRVAQYLIPSYYYSALNVLRSSSTSYKTGEKSTCKIDLNMISSMGNATTFPLQTIVYFSIAWAVHAESLDKYSLYPDMGSNDEITVFGDDCIIPSGDVSLFLDVMTSIGFIVNDDKSFWEPDCAFRESCGADYVSGRNVRPAYLPEPHNTKISSFEPWIYATFNTVLKKYISCFGSLTYVYDKEFFRSCFKVLSDRNIIIKVVPDDYPDDSGLKIASDWARFKHAYQTPNLRWARVVFNKTQGQYQFSLCAFQYKKEEKVVLDIRYADKLKGFKNVSGNTYVEVSLHNLWKNLGLLDTPQPEYQSTKRIGGYVVRRGKTSCSDFLLQV